MLDSWYCFSSSMELSSGLLPSSSSSVVGLGVVVEVVGRLLDEAKKLTPEGGEESLAQMVV